MNELISINYDDEEPTISARDLHKALDVQSRFSRWFDSNRELFVEGEDYNKCTSSTVVNNGAVRELEDYKITVLMAKHLAMMSRTEKGKQIRDYLIDLEKAWNTPEQVFARALKMADQTIAKLKDTNKSLAEKIEADRPKTIFADAVSANSSFGYFFTRAVKTIYVRKQYQILISFQVTRHGDACTYIIKR